LKTFKYFYTIHHSTPNGEDGRISRQGVGLGFLVLIGLGTMIMFFLGCGSGNSPTSKKPEKTAKSSGAITPQTAGPLLSGSKESRELHKSREAKRIEVVPGYTQEELEAKNAPVRKKYEGLKNTIEIAPGITQSEIDARNAETTKKYQDMRNNIELAPGITQGQVEARQAELQKKFADSNIEILPGITREQLNAKVKQQARPEGREKLPPAAGK
jgi:hypothetical protein